MPRGFDLRCDYYTPASVEKANLLTPTFGMRVAPMAYSPETGSHATGNASLGWLRRDENPWFFSNTFNQRVPGLNSLAHGVLAAIDSRTNKVVWKKEFRPGRPSGAMTTAGGLMFQSAPDGNVQAYHARTGNMLWQFRLAQPVDRRCHTRLTASSTSPRSLRPACGHSSWAGPLRRASAPSARRSFPGADYGHDAG